MYQSPVAVSKSLTPKPAPADNKAVAKSLPSGQSIQLAANLEHDTSIEGFDQNLGKSLPSSPFQFKLINGIPTNNHPIQRKSASTWTFQFKPVTVNSSSALPIQMASSPANKTGLPDNLKSGVESLSGIAMDDVKVHYNSDKPAQLQAHAYAQGTDIHVAAGQEKHLPHEAWHVVQQKQGRVQATTQLKGAVPVNDDAGLEQEADNANLETLRRFCRVMKIDLAFLISETMLITEASLNKYGRKNLTEIIYTYERMEHRIEVLEELQNRLQQMNSLN